MVVDLWKLSGNASAMHGDTAQDAKSKRIGTV